MKKSKQSESSKREDGVDMISKLPDDVLQSILSRLEGTEEVIRMSILSRRWRYLWTSLPSVDIDYARRLNPSQGFKRNKFKEFVNRVLLNKSLDLDSFRLWCADDYNMLTIRQWIHAAVMRKVKLLDLMFYPIEESEDIELPHSLVTCGSLEVLRLCLLGWDLSVPKFTGFPALRVLELNNVALSNDKIVKYFLESCPSLEDLSFVDCCAYKLIISSSKLKNLRIDSSLYSCDSLVICCPKLEFLKLTGYVATKFFFENLHSLKKAVIHPEYLFEREAPSFDLFARISHVEYLSISV